MPLGISTVPKSACWCGSGLSVFVPSGHSTWNSLCSSRGRSCWLIRSAIGPPAFAMGEQVSYQKKAPAHVFFYGTFRNAHSYGNVSLRKLVNPSKGKYLSHLFRQSRYGFSQLLKLIAIDHLNLR